MATVLNNSSGESAEIPKEYVRELPSHVRTVDTTLGVDPKRRDMLVLYTKGNGRIIVINVPWYLKS
jgi:hypothetical protein